jgi:hypothetical protein
MRVLVATVRGVLAVAAAILFIAQANAQVQIEQESGVIKLTGTVEEIVIPTRVITVIGPDGNTIAGIISPDVKDIEKIKLKETVTISFTQEVAVGLRMADGPPAAAQDGIEASETAGMSMNAPTVAEQNWTETTPSGDASELTTIEVTDTVSAVNHKQRTVTFAGTGGKTRTIAVPPGIPGFNQLEVGDMVVLEVTRAVVVDVKIS